MKGLKKKLSGLRSADCIICESRKKNWKTIYKIQEGFPITCSAECLIDLCQQLIPEGDGEIQKKQGDYQNCKGLTQKPLTSPGQHSICILHSYMTVLCWLFRVLYHCNQSYECWIKKQTIIGKQIQIGKKGLVLDQLSAANDKGSTSSDGNQARRFSHDFVDTLLLVWQ